jgi:hypothetical protein
MHNRNEGAYNLVETTRTEIQTETYLEGASTYISGIKFREETKCNLFIYTLYFFSWGRVRLSPLGTSATDWPTVSVPDDR